MKIQLIYKFLLCLALSTTVSGDPVPRSLGITNQRILYTKINAQVQVSKQAEVFQQTLIFSIYKVEQIDNELIDFSKIEPENFLYFYGEKNQSYEYSCEDGYLKIYSNKILKMKIALPRGYKYSS